ncbi:MAG: S8 family peptidase [Bacteroidota bacterium]|nr:S8 family peptidase [Bacteroidota bacterium]
MKITNYIKLLVLFFLLNTLFVQGQGSKKYWVYFKDKGLPTSQSGILLKGTDLYNKAMAQLTQKAIERRAKVLSPDQLVGAQDLPLNQSYIAAIQNIGGVLHQQVRWMNAASFSLTGELVIQIRSFPFVDFVTPVVRLVRKEPAIDYTEEFQRQLKQTAFDYGNSFAQYSAVKIPEVHEIGIFGEGVLVGMLDTGFRWRVHESLMRTNVIAERDFINNDDTTANQTGDPNGQDSHGTLTMSILGSYMPGKIIGPAFKSSFILAKTEYVPTETQIEEDWWAAGIEWMESNGVDVVSSSLAYDIFDDGSGYHWENGDFNGRTAVTSKAAARMARLGVVVVTAMGNEYNGNGVRGTLLCPADADSILSVGAVTISGLLANFSSTGPTNDGRIKPDIVTPGVNIYSAVVPGPASYSISQGTSAATPIAAGVVALVLSARPELTPLQVLDAIRNTADRVEVSRFPNHPNNFVGWGRANALKALSYPSAHRNGNITSIETFVTNSTGILSDSLKIIYTVSTTSFDTLPFLKFGGQPTRTIGRYRADLLSLVIGSLIYFYIVGIDSNYSSFRLPEDTSKTYTHVVGSSRVILDSQILYTVPTTYLLSQNYPNPFNAGTTIRIESHQKEDGVIEIYNLLGQRIRSFNVSLNVGRNYFYWDAKNNNGDNAPSGVYFYCIRTKDFAADKKMLLLR